MSYDFLKLEPGQAEQLQKLLDLGLSLPQAAEQMGLMGAEELMERLSEHLQVPYTALTPDMVNPQAVELVGEEVVRSCRAFPVMFVADILTVAMVDPADLYALDTLRSASKKTVNPILVSEDDFRACLQHFFTPKVRIQSTAVTREAPASLEVSADDIEQNRISIVRLVDMLLSEALSLNASDVHIEGARELTRIRYRVDGELVERHLWPKAAQEKVISRLMVMADLDITNRRTPQDGHFSLDIQGAEIDFRVATTPTERGPGCVVRILDQSRGQVGLEAVGMHADDEAKVRDALTRSQGFVLVTGPTGSGKTTTLYAMLNEVNAISRKIITIEDPVEYRLDVINQIPVNYRAGLDFATGLRSVLRQDPDIILVGEIRDLETARIAVQAALTGHLLLSTLHTNGTIETLFRLTDLGIEPFFVKEVLNCVVAQRLVRLLCPYCREEHEADPRLLDEFGVEGGTFYRPVGCYFCNQLGYKGRTAVTEVLTASDAIRRAIMAEAPAEEIRAIAVEQGLRTMAANGLELAREGKTTLEEVRRILPAPEGSQAHRRKVGP